jgi:hypothetical protein
MASGAFSKATARSCDDDNFSFNIFAHDGLLGLGRETFLSQ